MLLDSYPLFNTFYNVVILYNEFYNGADLRLLLLSKLKMLTASLSYYVLQRIFSLSFDIILY